MRFNPEEITSVIRAELEHFDATVDIAEVGTVLEVGDGSARIYGLEKAAAGELLEFANGVRAGFHTNCNSGIPERRMYICGTEGTIRADVIAGEIELKRIGFKTVLEQVDAGVSGGHGGGDAILAKELAASMLKGTTPSVGLDDGLKSSITCFAIDEAMSSGTVVDVRPYWKRAGIKIRSAR